MTHPVQTRHCPLDGQQWRRIGPFAMRECNNEHVYAEDINGDLTRIEYPEFTPEQIREAEAELYREGKVDELPNRRAALTALRFDFERQATLDKVFEEGDRAETRLRNRESLERGLAGEPS